MQESRRKRKGNTRARKTGDKKDREPEAVLTVLDFEDWDFRRLDLRTYNNFMNETENMSSFYCQLS